jgi:hypothetical protein
MTYTHVATRIACYSTTWVALPFSINCERTLHLPNLTRQYTSLKHIELAGLCVLALQYINTNRLFWEGVDDVASRFGHKARALCFVLAEHEDLPGTILNLPHLQPTVISARLLSNYRSIAV